MIAARAALASGDAARAGKLADAAHERARALPASHEKAGLLISIARGDELYLARRLSGVPEQFAEPAWESFRDRIHHLTMAATDQRGILFARGMQIVLDSELLMTDQGAEVDDLATSLVVDESGPANPGAVPCVASNTPTASPMFAPGAIPIPPT